MVKLDTGSLCQHEECRGRLKECRCRLKKTLDGHLSKATKRGDVYSPWTSTNTPPRPRGLHPRVRSRASTEETSHVRGLKSPAGVAPTHTLSVVLSAKEKETSLLFTNKDYKGLPARSHRKVQMRCHLRGNFPCLGEERAPEKITEFLADMMARLLGIARSSPQTTRVQRDALL